MPRHRTDRLLHLSGCHGVLRVVGLHGLAAYERDGLDGLRAGVVREPGYNERCAAPTT